MKKILMAVMVISLVVLSILVGIPAMAQDSTATPEPTVQATEDSNADAAPAAAVNQTDFFISSNVRVNVRSGPGTQYTIIGKLNAGDRFDVTGRLENSEWVRVNFNGAEGWVSASVINVTGDLATAPVAEAGENASTGSSGQGVQSGVTGDVVVITRFNTNLRAAPTINSDRLAVIPFNVELPLTGRNAGNNWVQVDYNGTIGWVSSGLLEFRQGNIASLPVIGDDGNPVEAAQPQPEGTDEPEAAPTTRPTPFPSPTPTAAP